MFYFPDAKLPELSWLKCLIADKVVLRHLPKSRGGRWTAKDHDDYDAIFHTSKIWHDEDHDEYQQMVLQKVRNESHQGRTSRWRRHVLDDCQKNSLVSIFWGTKHSGELVVNVHEAPLQLPSLWELPLREGCCQHQIWRISSSLNHQDCFDVAEPGPALAREHQQLSQLGQGCPESAYAGRGRPESAYTGRGRSESAYAGRGRLRSTYAD